MEMACAWPCHRCRAHDASHAACGSVGSISRVSWTTLPSGVAKSSTPVIVNVVRPDLRGVARRGGRAAISCDGRRSRDAAGAGARGHDARDGGAGRGAGKAKASERTHCII